MFGFLGNNIGSHKDGTIFFTMNMLIHLAFTATTGTFMHNRQAVTVWRNQLYS